MFRKYLRNLLLICSSAFLVVGLLNIIIDPYDIFKIKVGNHFNSSKPALSSNIRAYKLRQIKEQQPKHIILGTSRAQVGLPEDGLSEYGITFFNAGLPQATIDEIHDVFRFALKQEKLDKVILSVDFFSFNAYLQTLSPFKLGQTEYDPFSLQDKISAVIGWSGLVGSLETLQSNLFKSNVKKTVNPDIKNIVTPRSIVFDKNEQYYIQKRIYRPYPKKEYAFFDSKTKRDSFKNYKDILQTCYSLNIECKVVILPVHVRQLELLRSQNLWGEFDNWKIKLAVLTEEFSEQIPIYDFTGYHPINSEPVPTVDSNEQNMLSFVDGAHITPSLGKKIMQQIWIGETGYPDFGHEIQSSTLQAHLEKIRQEGEMYRASHFEQLEGLSKKPDKPQIS